MRLFRAFWIPTAVLLLWLLLSWLLGDWMGIHKPGLYYLRGGLSILGIIGFVGFLIMRPKLAARSEQPGVSSGELDDHLNEAGKRLQASGVKHLAVLPAVFFIGDSDTAKTSVIAKSDIAQLLAGQAQQDVAIMPTRTLNLWLAKSTIFVDPAGALLGDAGSRKRLFRKFSSLALRSLMGSRQMPARAVVLTVSCESLLQKGGADAMASKARHYQAILSELAQELGASFPVYVLFTKADKLSYFRDYVENLTESEANDVLGVTLPLDTEQGVYAQRETRRVSEAFRRLYYLLAERRPNYLIREHKAAALPNIYEFPREFNKLRSLVTSFLVDLCRPNQVGLSPFLRGFYFTGIRAVTVSDVAPAAAQIVAEESAFDSGATRMFTFPQRGGGIPIPSESRDVGARKIAQWVHLPQFLPGVVLADGTATSVAGSNVKLNFARRLWLGAAAAVALLMGLWWTISFANNRSLVHDALEAADGAPANVSLDALERLTKIKNTLATLNDFSEHGHPISYGGLLYSGESARDSVRKAYLGLFRRYLLQPTQEDLRSVCTVPTGAQTQDSYGFYYDSLKSYLITTQYHAKSTPEFLTPTLFAHWQQKIRAVEPREAELARSNFDFYSRELRQPDDYWPQTAPDGTAVANCREFLNRFGQEDRIYHAILADAGAGGKTIVFNDDYPKTDAYVVNRYPVPPAFTKTGYATFQSLLKQSEKYFHGESWVLGDKGVEGLDTVKLISDLQNLYRDDFIKTWTAYLTATTVRRPGSTPDAIGKLDQLAGNRSPLLLALCVAGENTAVDNKDIQAAFQPVQAITPGECKQTLIGTTADGYLKKLLALQESLKGIQTQTPDTAKPAQSAALDAEEAVKNIALGFHGSSDVLVKNLLLAPIYSPRTPVDSAPNDIAASMCAGIQPMLRKYPFAPNATEEATMDEVDKFLKKPDGLLWSALSSDKLKPYFVQLGDSVTASSSATTKLRPAFVTFLNRAIRLSRTLYSRDNGQTAGFSFTMKPVPSPDVEHISLMMYGHTLSTDLKNGATGEFSWPGGKEGADLKVRFEGGSNFNFPASSGLWGLWHFMELSTRVSSVEYEWVANISNRVITVGKENHPAAVHFTVDSGTAQVLQPRFFSLTCESKALQN